MGLYDPRKEAAQSGLPLLSFQPGQVHSVGTQ